ncbi:MAG: sulfur carrier protein ThiS [Planctomycetaceae bacterium]
MSGQAVGITVNGDRRAVAAGSSALDVLADLDLAGRPVAVEVNERVVPRGQLAACMLRDGDRLEIVTLVGGG